MARVWCWIFGHRYTMWVGRNKYGKRIAMCSRCTKQHACY